MEAPNIIIAGTIGLDTIATPFGSVTDALGGSAVYASIASSLFTPTGIVAVAGTDLPAKYTELMASRASLDGLRSEGQTFRWNGSYEYAMDIAKTKETKLGSLATWQPTVPETYKRAKVFFIANLDPMSQHKLLDWAHSQHPRPWLMLDTMNYWIEHEREKLMKAIERVDLLIVNDQEARILTDNPNLIAAGRQLLAFGPEFVIIKKGEHGALLFGHDHFFAVPGFPLSEVKDPTGAGDSFAGAIGGQVAATLANGELSFRDLINAVRCATVVASFTTESFSTDRLADISLKDVDERLKAHTTFTQLTSN